LKVIVRLLRPQILAICLLSLVCFSISYKNKLAFLDEEDFEKEDFELENEQESESVSPYLEGFMEGVGIKTFTKTRFTDVKHCVIDLATKIIEEAGEIVKTIAQLNIDDEEMLDRQFKFLRADLPVTLRAIAAQVAECDKGYEALAGYGVVYAFYVLGKEMSGERYYNFVLDNVANKLDKIKDFYRQSEEAQKERDEKNAAKFMGFALSNIFFDNETDFFFGGAF